MLCVDIILKEYHASVAYSKNIFFPENAELVLLAGKLFT